MRLSPFNLQGLLRRDVFSYENGLPKPESEKPKRQGANYVSAYECPKCDELHRHESGAEDCCQGFEDEQAEAPDAYALTCPVCGEVAGDAQEASDCCLWKDIGQETRHAMAHRVKGGSTWARELGVWPPEWVQA